MKNLLLSFIILFSAGAQATSLHPDTYARVAQLVNFDIDKNLIGNTILSAQVKVNAVSKQLQLDIEHRICEGRPGDGMATCAGYSASNSTRLPIVEVVKGSCGETIYVARRDARPVDGLYREVIVTDNSTMLCEIYLPADQMTVVEYTVVTPGWGSPVRTMKSYLSGTLLESPFRRR
jgi:hypothetical protein